MQPPHRQSRGTRLPTGDRRRGRTLRAPRWPRHPNRSLVLPVRLSRARRQMLRPCPQGIGRMQRPRVLLPCLPGARCQLCLQQERFPVFRLCLPGARCRSNQLLLMLRAFQLWLRLVRFRVFRRRHRGVRRPSRARPRVLMVCLQRLRCRVRGRQARGLVFRLCLPGARCRSSQLLPVFRAFTPCLRLVRCRGCPPLGRCPARRWRVRRRPLQFLAGWGGFRCRRPGGRGRCLGMAPRAVSGCPGGLRGPVECRGLRVCPAGLCRQDRVGRGVGRFRRGGVGRVCRRRRGGSRRG